MAQVTKKSLHFDIAGDRLPKIRDFLYKLLDLWSEYTKNEKNGVFGRCQKIKVLGSSVL